jgi:hypothetical protein
MIDDTPVRSFRRVVTYDCLLLHSDVIYFTTFGTRHRRGQVSFLMLK